MNTEKILNDIDQARAFGGHSPGRRRMEALGVIQRALNEAGGFARAEVANLRAENTVQAAMIEGARRAASTFMLREEQFLKALDRIRGRDATHGYKDAFEMCQLIAAETVQAYQAGKI